MKHNILKSVCISLILLAGASSAWAYTITLGWCEYGEYGVMYDNKEYYSKPNTNVTFEAPHGAKITVLEGLEAVRMREREEAVMKQVGLPRGESYVME